MDDGKDTTVACTNQVLMQTATAVVKNPQNDPSVSVHLILDSGSQRPYITENLAKGLKLTLNQTEKLSVVTFGSDKPKKIECRLSELHLFLKDGSIMSLRVTVVPNITGKINRTSLKTEDIVFHNKEFTKRQTSRLTAMPNRIINNEVLIGNDYYFELLQPRKIDLGEGLFLFHFKLGWILGGQVHNTTEEVSESGLLVTTVGLVPREIKMNTHMLTFIDHSLESNPNLEHF